MGAQQHPCEGAESHHPNRGTALEARQLCGVSSEVQLLCFFLFVSPVSLAEELTAALQQVTSHWLAQRLADATFLELKWLHGQGDMFSESHSCTIRRFYILTTILKTTPRHLIPERLSTELLSASFRIFCWGTNNLFPCPMRLLLGESMY